MQKWSRLSDLNRPPAVYDTAALPDELSRRVIRGKRACLSQIFKVQVLYLKKLEIRKNKGQFFPKKGP